ncbi:MAG: TonB-system energizer ExbB [Campylobacterales bacterium]|nr:TonB-system energizer ExbB [Campylobacterales bacterium]
MDVELLKDVVDYGIIGLLAFMGFISILFYIERLLFYKSIDLRDYNNKHQLQIDISNHLTYLSTTASNAPYIGLLGTVFGIIITFYTMGQTGNIDVKIIMSSLGLALKATAMGLLVAIPSMVFYNHLIRKVDVIEAKWDMIHND